MTPGVKFHPVVRRHGHRGSAVFVVLVLLAAMTILVIANTHTLHALKEELRLLEQRQNQRLRAGAGH